jgi:signal transduction histidine kinase
MVFQNKSDKFSTAEIKRITEPFEVGEQSRSNVLSGTGLGFSIIEQAITTLEGYYFVTQENGIFKVRVVLPIYTFA